MIFTLQPISLKPIVIVGASMLDVIGHADKSIILNDSSPGEIFLSPGGVSRNIAENLARLNQRHELISVICTDALGQMIKLTCLEAGVSIQHCYFDTQHSSTSYAAFLEPDGQMQIAISDTSSLDLFPLKHIQEKMPVILEASCIALDAALPEAILETLFNTPADILKFVDPVSVSKAQSLPKYLDRIYTLKCNRAEAEYLSHIKIKSLDDVKVAAAALRSMGVKNVFITLAEEGIYYHTETKSAHHPVELIQAINVTGAGDALMAGLIYAHQHNLSLEDTLKVSTHLSRFALMSMAAVNSELTLAALYESMEDSK